VPAIFENCLAPTHRTC